MAPARVLLEVGTHSPWVSRLLKGYRHEAVVVDPRTLDLIARSEKKTDRHDTSTLALLGRLDTNLQLLKTVDHRPHEMQADLAVICNRGALVRSSTLLINTIRGTVKSWGTHRELIVLGRETRPTGVSSGRRYYRRASGPARVSAQNWRIRGSR